MKISIPLMMILTLNAHAFENRFVSQQLIPIVVFPAFHFNKLLVTVERQDTFTDCPSSGTFEHWFQNDNFNTDEFSQECQDKLLTLVYDPNPSKPMSERFSEQNGVSVTLKDYGKTESAPFYEPLYAALEAHGYVRNTNIRVAGIDHRKTPDIGGFLDEAVLLIEETYHQNGNTPVHLTGHSNGPLYSHYLLTHTSQEWKEKYIHGQTPIAGNWAGQSSFYAVLVFGINVYDFSFPTTESNAISSSKMYLSHPSTYMSCADPDVFDAHVFGDEIIVVKDNKTGTKYGPSDAARLFCDAHLPIAQELAEYYTGFVKFNTPEFYPNVDTYGEYGSGIETMVGLEIEELKFGRVFTNDTTTLFTRPDGDSCQEDITNEAFLVWSGMERFRFEPHANAGVDHSEIIGDPNVLGRLIQNLGRPKSNYCASTRSGETEIDSLLCI